MPSRFSSDCANGHALKSPLVPHRVEEVLHVAGVLDDVVGDDHRAGGELRLDRGRYCR